ncbi:hypothetical protein [Pseudoalteromonas ruthenica]|uniref:hypothetical protein n=1 Tax=Pseudoalteromonas ruthenica TaxID=151081 RepID=UPI00241DD451|nr:hypothetical protein [Pseudoalteromonas ruthenica]|tara:strand:+ start:1874 stop:2080 length:207 start_codon:yes stop_codon:yes gene_type:complete
MFDNEPNYSSYSLDELFDAYSSIDKDSFPERFNLIKKLSLKNKVVITNAPSVSAKVMKLVNSMLRLIA